MRAPSLSGPVTAGLSTLFPLLSLLSTAQLSVADDGLSFNPVSYPDLDLSALGRVALTGDFNAVSLYAYTEQANNTHPKNGSQSISTPLPNGDLTTLANSDGSILDMCPLTEKDGTKDVFVAGNFTSLGGVKAQGVAKFDPSTKKVTPVPGLSGSVETMLCDPDTNSVYVGGDFQFHNGTNAAAWVGGQGWKSLGFGGFNGPVTSILRGEDGKIIFGGKFDGIGNSTHSNKNEQIINLQDAKIDSDAISPRGDYKDPKNIVCPTSGQEGAGKTWLLYDKSPGFWRAYMDYVFKPTKVRLYNTAFEGRGTKDFLLRALPDNGIMNLTYTDPSSNEKTYCDSSCPLPHNSDKKYLEFEFVNVVGMSGFQIEVLDWYGQGGGLDGVEIFQEDIYAFAVDGFNEPSCADINFPSKATRTGPWKQTPSGHSLSGYMSADVSGKNAGDVSVVLEPDVKQAGNYSVLLYTPGCLQDDDCDKRGIVDVSTVVSKSSDAAEPIQTSLYQTNYYEKYDTLFTGHVDASSGSFRPRVTLTPASGQGDITVVASRVRFEMHSASGALSGELNGLFEYDPATNSTDSDFTKSDVVRAGLAMSNDASVKKLLMRGNTIFAGGNFSNSNLHNILYFEDGNATALPEGGLNSEVETIEELGDDLYIGGNFTDTAAGGTKGLKHVAAYSIGSKSWSALGGGVNGPVTKILAVPLNLSSELNETMVAVSGNFDQILPFDSNPSVPVAGFAIWVPSHKNWLKNINGSHIELEGQLSAYVKVDNTTLYAGTLSSGGVAADNAASLLYSDGLNLDALLTSTDGVKSTGTGTHVGVYDTSSSRNLTILGGQFSAIASDGSSLQNLALIDGTKDTISGIGDGIDSNSTFTTLAVHEDILFAGGAVTGTVGTGKIALNGVVAWDLSEDDFARMQPPALNGDDVVVNSVAPRPGSSDVYIGGRFDGGGGYPCPNVCVFDSRLGEYSRAGSLDGTVLELKWVSQNELVAVGDLKVGGSDTAVATYHVKKDAWKAFDGASAPGTITAFSPANQDVSVFWVGGQASDGSAFLANYDGSNFHTVGDVFDAGTTIRGMEVLPLSSDHEKVGYLNKDQILMVTGQLVLPGYGNASAALFNGTAMSPFVFSSTSDGQPGSMSRMFYEYKNPYARPSKHHSNGIIVLVSFCCALGCVFLIVIAGVIANKIQRRRQGYMSAPQAVGTDRQPNMQRLPPEYLFNTLGQGNASTPAI